MIDNFTNAITKWLDTTVRRKVKVTTYDLYKYRIKCYIIPHFQKYDVATIQAIDIQMFLNSLTHKKSGKPLAPTTIRGLYSLLSLFFKDLVSQKVLIENPTHRVSLPKQKRKKITIFTKREQTLLFKELLKEKKSKNYLVLTALLTGMRLGELCSLTWENVDMKNNLIYVITSKRRIKGIGKTMVITGTPKTENSIRTIPVPKCILSYFRELKEKGSTYVFFKSNREAYDNRSIQKHFNKMLQKLEIKNKSFHTLRHTFATTAIESNMDIKTLSLLLGHSNVSITMNLYVHPDEVHMRKAMESVSRLFVKEH